MTTLLAIVQNASVRLLLPSPATVIGSTSNNVNLLKALVDQTIEELKDDFEWPELRREHTFTLTTNADSYALPADYDYKVNETLWNRTQHWPLIGPLDAVMWQSYQSGLVATLPRQRFQVKGWANNQFYLDPTPGSSENGQTCVYEYQSTIARRPKTWTANTVWTGYSYCSYNGYIFTRNSTGAATTGASAPTPTSLSDGTITWALSTTYPAFVADTDEPILDSKTIEDGAVWRFKRERGLDYAELRDDALAQLEVAKSKLAGAGVLSVNGGNNVPTMIGEWSYPISNYGL